jgi:hypothetical protein
MPAGVTPPGGMPGGMPGGLPPMPGGGAMPPGLALPPGLSGLGKKK